MAIRIVIVDDDPDFLDMASVWLQRCGADVRACGDAEACIRLFAEETPDVAILDGKLPGSDALWLVEYLRHAVPSAALIMLSGNADPAYADAAVRAGICRYLLKPCRLRDLEEAVSDAVHAMELNHRSVAPA
jgi:DNA-binding NtrC family response regulator